MDPLLLLQNAEDEANPESSGILKEKKSKKKKLTPAQAKKLAAKVAEELRQQQIRLKQEYLKETKIRVQAEWEANRAKAENYAVEFQWRQSELEKAFTILSEIDDFWKEHQNLLREKEEWQQYVSNTRLPNPSLVPEMNTYIFAWTELDKNNQMSQCLTKTEEVMKLLNGLELLIRYPAPESTPKSIQDMKELRSAMRDLLQDNIDRATFYLFSRIETDMVPINVTTSKYSANCLHFLMSLWAELIMPIPSSKGKEIRHPLKVTFEETDVTVVVPVSLLDVHKVMRSMWLYYDHWSDRCRTHDCPPLPNYFGQNMFQLFEAENELKLEILNYREKLEGTQRKKIGAIPAEPTLSQEVMAWESEPQRALSDEIAFREWEEEEEMGKKVKSVVDENEVNLRERTILGDLLLVEVLNQPPQPNCLRYKHSVTLRKQPPKLKEVDFYERYVPPEPEEPETTEEGEKRKERPWHNLSHARHEELEAKQKLVEIHLKPCLKVVWFEKPKVAHWNTACEYWSTEDIYDVAVDEDEGTISFKTGRLGLFGLHVSRYCNVPYEDWLLEPENDDQVKFYLKTPRVELYFYIREGEVCLESTRRMPSKVFNSILGIYFTPVRMMENMYSMYSNHRWAWRDHDLFASFLFDVGASLRRVLKEKGLDIFPPPDAAAYLENTQSKHFVVEKTIYQIWGLFNRTFRFKRSKFNQFAGKGNIVFQAQEINPSHQVNYCLIQNSMCSSYVLDITEETSGYSSEPASERLRSVELYGLLYRNSTLNARRLSEVSSHLLVATVKEFLGLVRPLSFS